MLVADAMVIWSLSTFQEMSEKRLGDMFIHRPLHIPSENDFLKLSQTHTHTPFESRKQKSVEANTVRACDKIHEDSSSWSKKYI